MMNVVFGGYTVERINVFNSFPNLKKKNSVTSFERTEIRDVCRRVKQMNVWIEFWNMSSKKEEARSLFLHRAYRRIIK